MCVYLMCMQACVCFCVCRHVYVCVCRHMFLVCVGVCVFGVWVCVCRRVFFCMIACLWPCVFVGMCVCVCRCVCICVCVCRPVYFSVSHSARVKAHEISLATSALSPGPHLRLPYYSFHLIETVSTRNICRWIPSNMQLRLCSLYS